MGLPVGTSTQSLIYSTGTKHTSLHGLLTWQEETSLATAESSLGLSEPGSVQTQEVESATLRFYFTPSMSSIRKTKPWKLVRMSV